MNGSDNGCGCLGCFCVLALAAVDYVVGLLTWAFLSTTLLHPAIVQGSIAADIGFFGIFAVGFVALAVLFVVFLIVVAIFG